MYFLHALGISYINTQKDNTEIYGVLEKIILGQALW